MYKIAPEAINNILSLRKQGYSIPEIHNATGVAKTTIQRYVKGVHIPEVFVSRLREKQGGSKERAIARKENSLLLARKTVSVLSERDRFFLLVGLYWGEGTKKDLSIINSDPDLIKVFVDCLKHLGVKDDRLAATLRIHEGISVAKAIKFWSVITGIPQGKIKCTETIIGKKKGKLKHGMCRVRVKSGIKERLLIQSSIGLIGK